ncbi:hypothetical protein M408DRAFT_257365 [Serendipita vermifera MAFF 305830]|uniref:Uncharacterized protein n=1 Tax=Serendipita vermifera MAFF 305830 TaxID=933852 RepID=A0A0C3B3A8_SERVB|nr:hypothetical protein M408DRAFT_257365 [Serendipita vermifera MAFF 305830]
MSAPPLTREQIMGYISVLTNRPHIDQNPEEEARHVLLEQARARGGDDRGHNVQARIDEFQAEFKRSAVPKSHLKRLRNGIADAILT